MTYEPRFWSGSTDDGTGPAHCPVCGSMGLARFMGAHILDKHRGETNDVVWVEAVTLEINLGLMDKYEGIVMRHPDLLVAQAVGEVTAYVNEWIPGYTDKFEFRGEAHGGIVHIYARPIRPEITNIDFKVVVS